MELNAGPLSGIRVVEMTLMVAGPSCGLGLSHLGAEVIKIESSALVDSTRGRDAWTWSSLNGGRLGAAVNLKHPESIALLKQLLATTDVLFYNMRQMALDRLGLDPETLLREVNPRLIIMSMSGEGTTGPRRDYSGVATTFVGMSGIAHLSGFKGTPPFELIYWPDIEFADWGVLSVLSALLEREQTGKGMYLDLAANEALSWYTGETFMDVAMNGRNAERDDPWPPSVIQGCYRTAGEERFISIAIGTDAEWQLLCGAMGREDLAADPRFATATGRRAHQPELDDCINEFTSPRENIGLAEDLQGMGIAAIPTFNGEELYSLPHLWERNAFQTVVHPITGQSVTLSGPAWTFSETPAAVRAPGPLLGEHNNYVFGEILGLPQTEIDRLTEAGALK